MEIKELTAYEAENKQLANDILDRNYYYRWKDGEGNLELFLTLGNNEASLNAPKVLRDLQKNKDNLFPSQLDDMSISIPHLSSILNWYKNNKFRCDISLLGDGWVFDDSFKQMFRILYETFIDATVVPKNIYLTLPIKYFEEDTQVDFLLNYINKFETDLNINFTVKIISYGAYIDEEVSNDLYKQVLHLIAKNFNHFYFECPIYQSDMSKWEDNARWWISLPNAIFKSTHFIEKSSNEWTDADVEIYQKVLTRFSVKLTSSLTNETVGDAYKYLFVTEFYDMINPAQIPLRNYTTGKAYLDESVHNTLGIRCSDLSVYLTAGLCVDELIIGNYVVEDDKIIDFIPKIVELFVIKDHLKFSCLPYCEACPYVGICSGYELPVAYEIYSTPLMPIRKHCFMQNEKIEYLIHLYNQLGVFDKLSEFKIEPSEKRYLNDLINYVEKKYEAE